MKENFITNISEEEIILAPPTELFEEAREIAQNTTADTKYPFTLQYDANQKAFLLTMLQEVGAVVEAEDDDGHTLDTRMNMTQLAFIKRLDCVERVRTDEGLKPFLAEEAVSPKAVEAETPVETPVETVAQQNVETAQTEQVMTLAADEVVAVAAEPLTAEPLAANAEDGIAVASVSAPARSTCCPCNTDMASAQTIEVEQSVLGCICCPGAEQWFKFTVPYDAAYTIYTSGSLDTIGELSGCCLPEPVTNDDYDGRINFRIVKILCAGCDYYIRVSANGDATGNYNLMVTRKTLAEEVLIHSQRSDGVIVLEKGKTYELPRGEGYGFLNAANTINAPFSVEVNPNDTADKRVYWTAFSFPSNSIDFGVGWKNVNGKDEKYQTITATGVGGVKLYAYDWLGCGKTGVANVAVIPNGGSLVKATSISLNHSSLTMDIGEYQTITATVSPSNATVQDVDWVSDNPNIATVTRYGSVKAVAPGTVRIRAKSMTGTPVVEAGCTVTVKGFYNIVNVETGKVANISGSYLVNLFGGENITLYSKSGSNEQVWKIDTISDSEDCYIRSYIDQSYGFNAYRSPSSNYNCNIHEISGNEEDAAVRFVLQEDGSYKIKLANYSNYYLTAIDYDDGSDIRWQPEDSEKKQHWKLEVADFSERESIATAVIGKIQSCSTDLIPSKRKAASVAVAQAMLDLGYPVSFVAGMLANIVYEGSTGEFESSNYVNNPKPDYLVYMDTEYNGTNYYLNNFSGKTIMDVGVDATYDMLCELAERSNNTWYVNGSRVGFGLGCIQWSFARTLNLVNAYKEISNNDSITTEQACRGEALLMLRELGSSEYNSIISSWKSTNTSLDSASAANSAGRFLCNSYIRPKDDTGSIATTRANRAASIYSAIAI